MEKLFVVDGRHRIKSLEENYKETNIDTIFYTIIYTVTCQEEMETIFKIRNSGTPVPEFILNPPEGKGPLLKEIHIFMRSLPLIKISKPGTKINRPNINLTNFMEYIVESQYLNECTNIEEFVKIFWKINKKIKKKKRDENWKKKLNITENMLEIISHIIYPDMYTLIIFNYFIFIRC